jgi:hypothetical protein
MLLILMVLRLEMEAHAELKSRVIPALIATRAGTSYEITGFDTQAQ